MCFPEKWQEHSCVCVEVGGLVTSIKPLLAFCVCQVLGRNCQHILFHYLCVYLYFYSKRVIETESQQDKCTLSMFYPIIEIIKEVKTNGENLTELLRVKVDDLEPQCLEKALLAAVEMGNHFNVGKLVVKGATNVEDALKRAKELRQHDARAMLLLVIAAQSNDKDLVLKLFGAPTQRVNQVSKIPIIY